MYQIDHPTAAAVRPANNAAGEQGWFTPGSVADGEKPTVLTHDFLNIIQAEFLAVLSEAGIDPSKTDDTQLLQAIQAIVSGGGVGGVPAASTTRQGVVELATFAEADAGTDSQRVITCLVLAHVLSNLPAVTIPDATSTDAGKVQLATDAEAVAGTNTAHAVTPHALKASLDDRLGGGGTSGAGIAHLPGGQLMQWGFQPMFNASSQSVSVTFPQAFSAAPASVILTHVDIAGTASFSVSVGTISSTAFNARLAQAASAGTGFYWQAIGPA